MTSREAARDGVVVVLLTALAACSSSAGSPEGLPRDAGSAESGGVCLGADSDALAPAHTPLQSPPPSPVGGFSIDLGDPAVQGAELAPGAELFPCVVYPLDVKGPSNLVGGGM